MTAGNDLSERELEILRLVATGASNKEIAQQLEISANTVKVHLRNIFAKIEVASRTEAAMFAVQHGLVSAEGTAAAALAPESAIEAPPEDAAPARARPYLPWALGGLILLALALAAWGGSALTRRPPATLPPAVATVLATEAPRWQPIPDLPVARAALALATYENQLFAIGGEAQTGPSGAVERFDLASQRWQDRAEKPTPVSEIGAAVIGGLIYVPGGKTASGQPSRQMEVYDPRQNLWTTAAPLPTALSGYALTAFEGRLYVFGGWDGQQVSAAVWAYDPADDAWQARAPMPTARASGGVGVAGGKLYVLGGSDGLRALTANEVYLPESDLPGGDPWQRAADLPEARARMGVAALADALTVVGGADQPGAATLIYQPLADVWQSAPAPDQRRWSDLGLIPLGARLIAVGGRLDGQTTARSLAYQAMYTIVFPLIP